MKIGLMLSGLPIKKSAKNPHMIVCGKLNYFEIFKL